MLTHIHCPYVDVLWQIGHLRFLWDTEKARSNVVKHSLSFQQACEIFTDPFMKLWDAEAHDEARFAAVGRSLDQQIFYVVHLEREDDVVRIISARRVTKQEQKRYEIDE